MLIGLGEGRGAANGKECGKEDGRGKVHLVRRIENRESRTWRYLGGEIGSGGELSGGRFLVGVV